MVKELDLRLVENKMSDRFKKIQEARTFDTIGAAVHGFTELIQTTPLLKQLAEELFVAEEGPTVAEWEEMNLGHRVQIPVERNKRARLGYEILTDLYDQFGEEGQDFRLGIRKRGQRLCRGTRSERTPDVYAREFVSTFVYPLYEYIDEELGTLVAAENTENETTAMQLQSKARIVAGGTNTVFLVTGRNQSATDAMMRYLTSLGVDAKVLQSIPYGEGSPNIETLLEKAFDIASGVIVLMTPDDESHLRDAWADAYDKSKGLHRPMFQPRMNVIFEIGLAWGKGHKRNTILVEMNKPIEGKVLRMPTDISENRFRVIMYDARSVKSGLLEIRQRLEDEILKCQLNVIDDNEQNSYADDFLRAIQETRQPVGIAGLDQTRWTARTVSGVRQGVDFRRVELGGPFRTLRVAIDSRSTYWRGGIRLEETGSPCTVPELIGEKSLLFHVGKQDNWYGVTGYYDSSWTDLRTMKKTHFVNEVLGQVQATPVHIELAVNESGGKNVLFCKVLEEDGSWQPRPPVEIPDKLGLLANVYLVAWGDSEIVDGEEVLRDYEVVFTDLEYELWKA